ncbi:MAG: flagellar protein FlaG [Aromatoleum sp.]|jgi:flagellar protein FlaG|uniref:flagellar protein FlaG n=1 Tax=Aromatoleum sp. TaxID=2307007 RepID=UPI00289616B6|nr:flagellar protein FlaG [Aromatoleum sp.]MDT3668876.1 flagellar protein FlaG [Aromatoleum sp.]
MSIQSVPLSPPVVASSAARTTDHVTPQTAGPIAATGRLRNVPAETSAAAGAPSSEDVLKALDEVREAVKPVAQSLHFSLDQDTGRTVVKVIDTETNEMIRQIPSEDILKIAHAIDKLQGLLIKQHA